MEMVELLKLIYDKLSEISSKLDMLYDINMSVGTLDCLCDIQTSLYTLDNIDTSLDTLNSNVERIEKDVMEIKFSTRF